MKYRTIVADPPWEYPEGFALGPGHGKLEVRPLPYGSMTVEDIGTTRKGGHSAKPEAWLDYIEQVSPGPYVEMFARRARFGWDYWGDQSLGTAEMVA